MDNFMYYNPVRILFGRGEIANLTQYVPKGAKVMVTYGQGSIKGNGVYDQVLSALKEFEVCEFGGIEPNPEYETLMRAASQIQEEGVDFVLAVGGGSVIDGTKFIVAAAKFEAGDPWDILTQGAEVKSAVPFGSVLTLPATGSEMNAFSVVSRRATGDKLPFESPFVFPQFSVLDPETTFTLPEKQIANGVVDAFTHVMEQYLTYPANAPLQDRFAEGILLTLIEEGPRALTSPKDYNVRASVMWCACMALNSLINRGVPQDWSTHMIGHELTAEFGLDHAQTLAIVLPNIMQHQRKQKREKLLQYAERIWGIATGSDDERIDAAIASTKAFFESLGVPTTLAGYDIAFHDPSPILEKLEEHGMLPLGERKDIELNVARKVLEMCA